MIPISDADALLRPYHRALAPAKVPLEKAIGLILREDLRADRAYPPMDRVCMDGIAIRRLDWEKGLRRFVVAGMAKAGDPPGTLDASGRCMEVATGAPCPAGADSVIPYERLRMAGGMAELVEATAFAPGQNVCVAGTDCAGGAVLIRKGRRLTAPGIGAAASVGSARLLVTPRPRLALLGTGDELIDIRRRPLPWQLRRSNPMALESLFAGLGEIRRLHAGDDPAVQTHRIRETLVDADILVMTGGVSAGRYDIAPASLAAAGVREIFHKVAIRPGKPIWFGIADGERPVFALPGNPVSALLCARRFVVPMLLAMAGLRESIHRGKVRLASDLPLNGNLTHLIPVRIDEIARGQRMAHPVSIRGSGDFAGLVHSDGYLEAPKGGCRGLAGQAAEFTPWSPMGLADA